MKATKRITRLCSILLAVVIVMAMSVSSAFAAQLGTGNGSITITNATVGQTYTIYKIFDTLEGGNGPTATGEQKTFYESKGEANPFVFTSNGNNDQYVVTVKNGFSEKDVTDFLQGFVTADTDADEDKLPQIDANFAAVIAGTTSQTATSTSVKFDNIPYGYYLVISSLGATVTIDSTNPDQTVIDKNQQPGGGENGFTKTVDDDDEVVEIGQEIPFTIHFNATNYDGETKITEYTITDTLPAGMELSYDEESENGTYGVNVNVGTTSVTLPENSISYVDGANGTHVLTINIPWVYDTDAEDGSHKAGDFMYTSPIGVDVTYNAVLTGTAAIQENIENDATLTWTGDSEGTSTSETVQTYAMAIMKVDEKGNSLSGAEFAVTKANPDEEEAETTPYVNVPVTLVSSGDEENPSVYVVNPNSESNTVVSPASGLIVIKGVDNVEYTLTETKAPNGYNLLGAPETVIPASTGSTTITIYKDENGNVTEEVTGNKTEISSPVKVTAKIVENKAGSELPSTGGMGTTVIYIVGGVLVAGAAVLLVTRRRMHA